MPTTFFKLEFKFLQAGFSLSPSSLHSREGGAAKIACVTDWSRTARAKRKLEAIDGDTSQIKITDYLSGN